MQISIFYKPKDSFFLKKIEGWREIFFWVCDYLYMYICYLYSTYYININSSLPYPLLYVPRFFNIKWVVWCLVFASYLGNSVWAVDYLHFPKMVSMNWHKQALLPQKGLYVHFSSVRRVNTAGIPQRCLYSVNFNNAQTDQ